MIAFPPAKINLGLHIIRKRPDGYHDLSTCFYPVPWCDILEILPSDKLTFDSSGLPVPGDPNDNLCLKAYQLLKKDFNIPSVKIHLHKIIPMGAGLGGGSSDGAWTLRLLNELFGLAIAKAKLKEYASILGSDCALFIEDVPVMGSSRGEIVTPTTLSLKGKFIVIVKPDVHVSTAEAFAGIKPQLPEKDLQSILKNTSVEGWRDVVNNDFEASVFKKHPVIQSIKEKLYSSGALYASMSGSGSAVFGIFRKEIDLRSEFDGLVYWERKL
jgi:4-diphosphocytidyl-2-C-methyl-D-erythritol kinase